MMDSHQKSSPLLKADVIHSHNNQALSKSLFMLDQYALELAHPATQSLLLSVEIPELLGALFDQGASRLELLCSHRERKGCCCGQNHSTLKTSFKLLTLSFIFEKQEEGVLARNIILNLIRGKKSDLFQFVPRNYLVCVNPHSGKGEAVAIFQSYLRKLRLVSGGGQVDLLKTNRTKHLHDLLKKMPANELEQYTAVITISGDGLPHEAINGLLSRPDFPNIKTVVVPFPGGSGNGWVTNILHDSGMENNFESMLYVLSRETRRKHDLMKYTIDDGQQIVYGFLSFYYGFFGDVDIDSEFLRFMGSMRFDIYATWRWVFLREYQGRIAYSLGRSSPFVGTREEASFLEQKDSPSSASGKWDFDSALSFYFLMIVNLPFISSDFYMGPLASHDDGYSDLVIMGQNRMSRCGLLKYLLSENERSRARTRTNHNYEYTKIKRFLLDVSKAPRTSYFDIDGERYNGKKIMGTVLEKSITIFSEKKY
jgi:sphingosine kinase